MKGTWWYKYTAVRLKFCIYIFLHKGSFLIYHLLTAAHQVVQIWGWSEASNRIKSPRPQEGAPHAPIPRVKPESERQSVWFFFLFLSPSSSPLSLSSWSYHTVGSFLSLQGSSLFPSLCLLFLHRLQDRMMMRRKTTAVIPPPMANARRRSSEKEAGVEKETQDRRLSVLVTENTFSFWDIEKN